MRLYDRTTNRKSHAHAARLCGEEWIENAIYVLRIDSRSGILDCNNHFVGCPDLRSYGECPRALRHGAHGFAGVHDQIENDLLQLNLVA